MVQSKAATVSVYLGELPAPRRAVVAQVRKVIRRHLPKGYVETMNWGMICYEVPLKRYPNTYNGKPLMYAGLAAQKNNYALYLSCVYQDPAQLAALKAAFKAAGKKADMGKSCIRFKQVSDLPLDAIAAIIAGTSVDAFIEGHESARAR